GRGPTRCGRFHRFSGPTPCSQGRVRRPGGVPRLGRGSV
ncbi:MAG: hypothetical protein AVDCRST_MAG02-1309, partial [uncultured Rubrobacteraceae bacterium]